MTSNAVERGHMDSGKGQRPPADVFTAIQVSFEAIVNDFAQAIKKGMPVAMELKTSDLRRIAEAVDQLETLEGVTVGQITVGQHIIVLKHVPSDTQTDKLDYLIQGISNNGIKGATRG